MFYCYSANKSKRASMFVCHFPATRGLLPRKIVRNLKLDPDRSILRHRAGVSQLSKCDDPKNTTNHATITYIQLYVRILRKNTAYNERLPLEIECTHGISQAIERKSLERRLRKSPCFVILFHTKL